MLLTTATGPFYIIFCLKVFDVGNESWVPEALFQNEYPSTEAHINVEVVLRPKIDVYPASTTLVKVIKDLDFPIFVSFSTLLP